MGRIHSHPLHRSPGPGDVLDPDWHPAVRAKYQDADHLIGPPTGVDHTAFINELEFRNILAFRIVLLSEALMTYNRLRDALVKLQRQIDQELTA